MVIPRKACSRCCGTGTEYAPDSSTKRKRGRGLLCHKCDGVGSVIFLSIEIMDKYFDFGTSVREMTDEFANGELSKNKWLECFYWRPAKNFAKQLLKECGSVWKCRQVLKKRMHVLTNMDFR